MGDKRNANRFMVGKSEGKKQLGRPRRREENKIRINPNEMEEGNVDWIFLDQKRGINRAVSNMVMNCQVP
jgi:hypothetical protein